MNLPIEVMHYSASPRTIRRWLLAGLAALLLLLPATAHAAFDHRAAHEGGAAAVAAGHAGAATQPSGWPAHAR